MTHENDPDCRPERTWTNHSTRTLEASVHAVGGSALRTISIRGFRLNSGEGGDVAGFDLGPGPEEHFLGALGASLAKSLATVACRHELCVDRVDIEVEAAVVREPNVGRFEAIAARIRLESTNPPAAFDGIEEEVLANSGVASALRIDIDLSLQIEPIDQARRNAGDWQI